MPETLLLVKGVGEKIADCVLAFFLDKPESFIVDRHILRALRKWYGLSEKCSLSYASEWARDHFGEYSALANQYMFHRERFSARAIPWGGPHVDRAFPKMEFSSRTKHLVMGGEFGESASTQVHFFFFGIYFSI
ncbi:MAG: hypothetical protein Ct9H300mP19_09750 [Dehalococcoidia bacterium]|nr:MAG: hypothetical protein Ct9H300mP19_09750 [Dehalococcoidia bacterium]